MLFNIENGEAFLMNRTGVQYFCDLPKVAGWEELLTQML
jgi:hypothetical protein